MGEFGFLACQVSRFDGRALLLRQLDRLVADRECDREQRQDQWCDGQQDDFLSKLHGVLLYRHFRLGRGTCYYGANSRCVIATKLL